MNFRGSGRPYTAAGLAAGLTRMGLDPVNDMGRLWAILTVESRGFGFGQDRRPKILFERHIFSSQTNGQFDGVAPDISNKVPGGYLGGDAEFGRLQKAIDLLGAHGAAPEAALRSASWGLGQVMGFNFADAGFASATDLVQSMLDQEDQHVMAMANFVEKHALGPKLKANEWTAVAVAYNGQDQVGYDIKLRDAFQKFDAGVTRDLSIRTAQAALLYLGFGKGMGDVDGILGDNTRRAIRMWRVHAGLSDSDRLDGDAYTALMAAAAF